MSFVLMSCGGIQEKNIFELGPIKEGEVIVSVNDTEIHQGLLDTLTRLNPKLQSRLNNPMARKKLLNSLIDQHLLFQAAIAQNLHQDEKVLLKTYMNYHSIISNAYIQEQLEGMIQKAYEKQKDSKFTKIAISRIFASYLPIQNNNSKKDDAVKPSEKQKKEALNRITAAKKRIDNGEDFEKVAQETTDEIALKKRGGKAGMVAKTDKKYKQNGLQALLKKAFELKKDQVSEPIVTKNGYYIIKVTSDPVITPFESAKKFLAFELQSSLRSKLIADLRKSAKITWNDKNLKDNTSSEKPKVQIQQKK